MGKLNVFWNFFSDFFFWKMGGGSGMYRNIFGAEGADGREVEAYGNFKYEKRHLRELMNNAAVMCVCV